MPCFNISWIGIFLFLYFWGNTKSFIVSFIYKHFLLLVSVFFLKVSIFPPPPPPSFFFLLGREGGREGVWGFLCNILKGSSIRSIIYLPMIIVVFFIH